MRKGFEADAIVPGWDSSNVVGFVLAGGLLESWWSMLMRWLDFGVLGLGLEARFGGWWRAVLRRWYGRNGRENLSWRARYRDAKNRAGVSMELLLTIKASWKL